MKLAIRPARREDAQSMCGVLRRSITELCGGDHHHDPAILAAWLGNKTPETLCKWISDPCTQMMVATEDSEILAVGGVRDTGEITLNYVLPSARKRGISKRMIAALEALAKERGVNVCTVHSTGTARRFYLALGYSECEPRPGLFGPIVYPMTKRI